MTEHRKSVLAAELFATLKQRILRWEYPPGHRFTEEEICKAFGVSRSPVREALRMLEENGLVDKVPYRGCTVKQPNLQELNEVYDVRMILELAAVEQLAACGISGEVLASLCRAWQDLAQTGLADSIDGAELANQDRAFHEALAQATGNQTLHDMLRAINDRLHFIRMTDITTVDRLWDTCRQHLQILEYIAAADVVAAREAMRANIDGARVHVYAALKEAVAQSYLAQVGRAV